MGRYIGLKALNVAVIIVLLSVLMAGLITPLPQASADDYSSKISSDILKAIAAKTGQSQAGSQRILQGQTADPSNVMVFIYMNSKPDAAQMAEMASLGITAYADSWIPPVGVHPQGYITALVPAGKVGSLASRSYVVRLDSAEKQNCRMNDLAAYTINAQTLWSSGYTGTGVRVAVLDDGLDTTHPDFPTPVFAKDYWQYPIIGNNVISPNPGGSAHGTHVAGSVLGRGSLSGGKYKGMAPGASLVFLKIGNNTTGGASDAAMNGALKDAIDLYGANIISMSYGGWSSHHDGTNSNCQAADYAVSKGAVVLISAGNDADDAKHYRGTVTAGSTTGFIQVNVTGSDGTNCTLEHNMVWYDGPGVHNELMLQYYDSSYAPIFTQYWLRQESTRGTERRQFAWGDPISNVPAGSQTYYIKVTNSSVNDQVFHIYFEGAATRGGLVKFASPDIYYTVGSPGDADSVICVGSYNSKYYWTDYTGTDKTFGETLGQVSSFSSRGPRVDPGAPVKPTVVAPGCAIISCRDRSNPLNIYTISDTGTSGLPADYYAMQGTSMATPVCSGATALLLQAFPRLRGNQAAVRSLLQRCASRASNPDYNWGYGLIDLQRAMRLMAATRTVTLNAPGNQPVTFNTSGGSFNNASAKNVTQLQSQSVMGLPSGFPYGLFDFDIDELGPGESFDVTITLPQPGLTQFWLYTHHGWVQVPVVSLYGNIMVIRLTDGGIGDEDDDGDGDFDLFGGPALGGMDGFGNSTQNPPSSASGGSATTTQPVSLPSISVQSATVSAAHADAGQAVDVKALVSNQGRVKGDASVKVFVNGTEEENLGVTVAAGQTVPVHYTFRRNEPGTYTITVNNVSAGTVIVEDAAGNSVVVMAIMAGFVIAIIAVSLILYRRLRIAR
jgi:subtilisin family serine protease